MGALDRIVVQILPLVPRAVVRRFSERYIAGTTVDEALATVAALNRSGVRATVDVLGEFVTDLRESAAATRAYVELFERIAAAHLDTQASVKLTQLGLKIDRPACERHLHTLVETAARHDNLLTIDMEDSSCTEATLDIFAAARRRSAHVGAVLQACLRRSRSDLEALLPLHPNIRICKGIYIEPESIAFTDRESVRKSYLGLVESLLCSSGFVGIATHDAVLLRACRELIRRHGATSERYEFQMLLGVREDLRRELMAEGHPVRVYVPFGDHWYAYSLRRLKENPAIAGHVLRGLFERRR
jgi:proline dehydrogenase